MNIDANPSIHPPCYEQEAKEQPLQGVGGMAPYLAGYPSGTSEPSVKPEASIVTSDL